MKISTRNRMIIENAFKSIFYISKQTDDEQLKIKCQNMLDILFIKFPEVMPSSSISQEWQQ